MPFLSPILFVTYSANQFIGLLLSGKIKEFSQVGGMSWDLAGSTQRKARSRAAWFRSPLSQRRPFFSRTDNGGSRSSVFFAQVVKPLIDSQNLGIFSAISRSRYMQERLEFLYHDPLRNR